MKMILYKNVSKLYNIDQFVHYFWIDKNYYLERVFVRFFFLIVSNWF